MKLEKIKSANYLQSITTSTVTDKSIIYIPRENKQLQRATKEEDSQ